MLADIEAWIEADFPPSEQGEAGSRLRRLGEELGEGGSPRVLRCVLSLSRGDIAALQLWANESLRDWRDVIVAAELGGAPGLDSDCSRPDPECRTPRPVAAVGRRRRVATTNARPARVEPAPWGPSTPATAGDVAAAGPGNPRGEPNENSPGNPLPD